MLTFESLEEAAAAVEKLEAVVVRLVYLHSTYGFTSAFMREADALYHELTDKSSEEEPEAEPSSEPTTEPEATEPPEAATEPETASDEPTEAAEPEPEAAAPVDPAAAFAALSPEEQAAALQSVRESATDTAS